MPERVRVAEREDQEALGRSSRAVENETPVPATDDLTALGRLGSGLGGSLGGGMGSGPSSSGGFSRVMNPATLMAMQRLAGNRATVQAIGRRQAPGMAQTLNPEDEELAFGGDTGSAGQMTSPKLANAAAGPAGGGGPPGSGNGDPNAKGSETATKPDLLKDELGSIATSDGTATRPDLLKGQSGSMPKSDETATKPNRRNGSGASGTAPRGSESARRFERPPITAAGAETATAPEAAGVAGAGAATSTSAAGSGDGAPSDGAAGVDVASESADGPPAPASAPASESAQAPAPAAPAATTPGALPAAETASTGIDWVQILADYGPPARTVFEITRIIPGWGLLGGLAADSINFASDLAAIPNSENADLATGLVVFRNFVNIGNNGVGHVLYVNQLIQDGLAGSVVGAEFTPLTAAANTVLSTVKVGLDEVMLGTDIIIEVESIYQSNHAPTSAEAEQWRTLADGYAANILGDVVNLVLDLISLSSAGAANTAPIQQARLPLTLAGAYMRNAAPNIISAVNGVLGVWLGALVTEGRHAFEGSPTELRAQALTLDAAGLVVDIEGPRARATYDAINIVIDALSAYADHQIEQINMVAEALSGGKTAFQLIRDAVREGLDDMTSKLGMVQQLGALASNGQTNAAAISAACATVLDALDALTMPDVTLPSVELGEGVVADAAEAIANQAAAAANVAITLAMSNVERSLDRAKDTIRGPVEAVQERAEGLGEWLALLATECASTAGTLGNQIASFSDGLGRCTNIEQVIDLIIGQVSDLTGTPRVTVQEIRDAWNSVGPYIDQFTALGPRMHDRASALRANADLLEAGGEESAVDSAVALPPGPPQDPDADAAAMAAVA